MMVSAATSTLWCGVAPKHWSPPWTGRWVGGALSATHHLQLREQDPTPIEGPGILKLSGSAK
jgi:hypothetical protein